MPSLTRARRPVAVVDERTYRHACRVIDVLLTEGDDFDLPHVHAAMLAIRGWLRYEIHTGSRRKAAERAARLEQWEMRLDNIRRDIGLLTQ